MLSVPQSSLISSVFLFCVVALGHFIFIVVSGGFSLRGECRRPHLARLFRVFVVCTPKFIHFLFSLNSRFFVSFLRLLVIVIRWSHVPDCDIFILYNFKHCGVPSKAIVVIVLVRSRRDKIRHQLQSSHVSIGRPYLFHCVKGRLASAVVGTLFILYFALADIDTLYCYFVLFGIGRRRHIIYIIIIALAVVGKLL
jgi:hypothetical protein